MRISDWSSDVCSSDLAWSKAEGWSPNAGRGYGTKYGPGVQVHYEAIPGQEILKQKARDDDSHLAFMQAARSEEHTSELQSLMRISYAVFCLKKKKTQCNDNYTHMISTMPSINTQTKQKHSLTHTATRYHTHI